MKRLTCLATAACCLALTSCSESQQTESTAADTENWEPAIYSAARQDDGVVLGVVLLAEKKMQFYAGERLLPAFWTCADVRTDVFFAVRDGGMILGSGITTTADRLGLGEVVFSDGFPDLKVGVNDIVLGTVAGQTSLGVRLIPSTEKEMRAIRNHQPVGRTNPVSTGDSPELESIESLPTTLSPKARAFVESVEKDPTGFFFSVSFWEQTGMSQGIVFTLEAQHQDDKKSIVTDKKEAMAITLHIANNGMLDKTDVHPPGVTSPGWSVFLGTEKVEAYWHLGKERDALLKSANVMGVRSVLTGKSLTAWDDFMRSVRGGKSHQSDDPNPDHSSKSESATGIEVDWGGVKMTSREPRILPVSMKEKIRERMSPREIVTTFGKGWMSKQSSVGSISWRFEDGSMIHMNYRPGTTLMDEAVNVHRYEPPKKEGETIKTDKGGGSVSYMFMLQVSRRPLFGDFQGARFPASELRHLNELLAKGAVNDDWDAIAQKENYKAWSSYTLSGEFTYAGEPFVRVEIEAFRKPVADSDLFDLKHIVILRSSRQAGRKVVYTDNPDLVAYVEGDFMRKLAEWNPTLERERFPGGPYIVHHAEGLQEHGLAVTHKQSKVETSLGELAVTEYFRGDSLILKKVVPPDESQNTVYYVIHNGFEVLTYKSGPAGTEFAEAGIIRDQVKPDYTIKMAGDKEGRIQRITLYSPDFSKTYDGFWLRNSELIPWSADELEGWRRLRDSGNPDKK